MLDLLQTIFIWCLYFIFPIVLIIRYFGLQKTGVMLAAIVGFNTVTSLPHLGENVLKSLSNKKDLTTIILASSHTDKRDEKTLPSINRKNKKKFNLALHIKLQKEFPDWDERINYQKKQEKFYKSAMKKQAELGRLRIISRVTRYYTKEELDAISYFKGTGFYAKQQDPNMKPNIFDTRQTFLLKLQDKKVRMEFVERFNNLQR